MLPLQYGVQQYHGISIIYYIYKNESLFPLVTTSRVRGWADFAHSFFKMFFEVQRGSSWRKNSKNFLENSEKSLKHLSLAAAA